jgi:hypothetical protein
MGKELTTISLLLLCDGKAASATMQMSKDDIRCGEYLFFLLEEQERRSWEVFLVGFWPS